jgi:hypothetical protein
MDERKQFTFYAGFAKSISRIKKAADRAAAYDAIVEYALYGIEPNLEALPDAAAIVFELSKPVLDSSRRKAESGKKGGSAEASAKQNESKQEANDEQSESKNKNKYKNKNKNNSSISPISSSSRFIPPTVDEVAEYCQQRNNGIDPVAFVNFYKSKGWKVGKDKMTDWKAAVITWERKRDERAGNTGNAEESPSKWNISYA